MRVPQRKPNDYPLIARIIFWAQKKKYGESLLPSRIWGRSPKLLYGLQAFYRTIDRANSPIEPALRALINVQVSRTNHCAFCTDIGEAMLKKRGVSLEKLSRLKTFRTDSLFSDRERSALIYAESMTDSDQQVTAEIFEGLKTHFSMDEIIELTALIGYQNMTSKFNAALDIPSQGFCLRP